MFRDGRRRKTEKMVFSSFRCFAVSLFLCFGVSVFRSGVSFCCFGVLVFRFGVSWFSNALIVLPVKKRFLGVMVVMSSLNFQVLLFGFLYKRLLPGMENAIVTIYVSSV